MRFLPLLAAAATVGCASSDDPGRDVDAGLSSPDAAAPDAALPDASPAGFGRLSGDCDVLDDELTAPEPSTFASAIDFDRAFTDADSRALTDGGREILRDGNAGGSSLLSELFAFELLARCDGAALLKTETEVTYDEPGAITDLLVDIDGEKVGVSVTRAVGFPFDAPYTVEQASELVEGKLADILESTAAVSAEDRWRKQILAVLAFAPGHATSLATALDAIDPGIRADTIVWVLVTDGADEFIYCDGPCDDRASTTSTAGRRAAAPER